MKRCLVLLLPAAVALLSAPVLGAPTVLVTDVVGEAYSIDGAKAPLKLLEKLGSGTEIAINEGEVTIFYLADGAEYRFHGPGRYRVGTKFPQPLNGAPSPQRKATPASYRDLRLRTDRLEQSSMVMRGSDHPLLLAPAANDVLPRTDVRFAWESFGANAIFKFELADQAGLGLVSMETQDTALQLPPAVQLVPGKTYYWSVRGRDPSGTQMFYRVAEFRVADAETMRRLDAARPKPDAPFSERALYTELLEELGLKTTAQTYREALAAERTAQWAPSH